jgi:plasmid maintenance system killer protein
MSKMKLKIASILLVFGFSFGMVTDVTTNFLPQTTTTAQASTKLTASQKKQIAKINASLSKKQMAAKNWIAYHESSYSKRKLLWSLPITKILSTWQLISSQSGKSG